MADNRKMIAAGVVLVGVLLAMTACARSETSFKFHPALGICNTEEELYEAKNPMQELDTEYGSATMEYVVWKDGFLHVKIVADYSSDADDWEQADQFLSVQDEEKSKLTSLSRYCNYDEEQKQLTIEQEYRSQPVWNHKAEKALPRTWSVRYENTWPVIHKISTN